MMVNSLSLKDVSVVVCTKNAASILQPCLESLSSIPFKEIIIVDASSRDETQSIAMKFGCKIFEDTGDGLGAARNIGVSVAQGAFVLNFGPDNTTTHNDADAALAYLLNGEFSGVSFVTRIRGSSYLEKALNFWRMTRFREGPTSVIGTPSLFLRQVLVDNPFSDQVNYSDDGELCDRLLEGGHTLAISSGECFEHGKGSWREIQATWKLYGSSDFEHWARHRERRASLSKLISSALHPLRVELLEPLLRRPIGGIIYLPILLSMVYFRYSGWARSAKSE